MPVDKAARHAFFRRYGLGLALLMVGFLTVTILRSIRADFAVEIRQGLGFSQEPAIFTRSEIWVALGVVVINGLCVVIRHNRVAFNSAVVISIGGLILIGAALAGLENGRLGGFAFMVLIGLGLYVPYVAFHTTIFERLIAMTRDRCNLGFLMQVADATGYLGFVAVMLAKEIVRPKGSLLDFFVVASLSTCILSGVLLMACFWVFNRASRTREWSAMPQA